jgi:hypothetical protein
VTGTSIAMTATVTQVSGSVVPTGTATFKDGSTTLGTGTLTAGNATFTTTTLAVGSHTITASYGGDTGNLASTSTSITVTITTPPAADFTMSATPTSTTGTAGASQVSTIAVTPVNGFNSATSLTCSGLPSHSSCTFNPASVTPTGTTAATSTLTIATNVQTAAIALPLFSGQRPIANAGILASLLLLPLARSKSRKVRKLLAVNIIVLIATLTAIGTTGCAVEKKITPSGTYAITVTGTSGSLTHNATFTVTIQ